MESKPKCIDCDDTGYVWEPVYYTNGEMSRTVERRDCHCKPKVPSRVEVLEAALIKARKALQRAEIAVLIRHAVTRQSIREALSSINEVLGGEGK